MSSAQEFFAGLGRGSTWAEQVEAVKAEHGAGASRWLAARLGKSMRTAQRYLTGQIKHPAKGTHPAGLAAMQKVGDRARAAARIRSIRQVAPGVVDVESISSGRADGTRRPGGAAGWLDVSAGMAEVARAWEAGEAEIAADLFNQSVIAVYAGEPADYREGVASQIGITDYQDGISYR